MKSLNRISLVSLLGLAYACGSQLVEFPDSTTNGGSSGRAGMGGSSGRAGMGGSSGGAGTSGANGMSGQAGMSGEAGLGGQVGLAGEAGRGGEAGLGGEAGHGGEAGIAGEAGLGNVNPAPFVITENPANTDVRVAINKTVVIKFSEPMDPLSINMVTVTVTGPGLVPVSGAVGYDAGTTSATFDPTNDLLPNTQYTVTVTTGATDLLGTPLTSKHQSTFTTGSDQAQTTIQLAVPLGAASPFVILASAAITNIVTSKIFGDVGLTPDAASNISGFSVPATCPEITGKMYVVDATGPACAAINPVLLSNAKTAAGVAFTNATAAVRGTPQAIAGDLNGLTLYPGLYESGSSLEISPGGFLYLDAQGDQSAIFIIRSATSITTAATSQVILTKGAKAGNVYWTAGSAVTLGTNSIMKGTIIAGTAISFLTGANLEGRALNQGPAAAAISLDASTVSLPLP